MEYLIPPLTFRPAAIDWTFIYGTNGPPLGVIMPEHMVPQKTVTLKFLKAREGHEKGVEIQVDEGEARRLIDAGWATQITREGQDMAKKQQDQQQTQESQGEQQQGQQPGQEQQQEGQSSESGRQAPQAPPEPEKKD